MSQFKTGFSLSYKSLGRISLLPGSLHSRGTISSLHSGSGNFRAKYANDRSLFILKKKEKEKKRLRRLKPLTVGLREF